MKFRSNDAAVMLGVALELEPDDAAELLDELLEELLDELQAASVSAAAAEAATADHARPRFRARATGTSFG